MLYTHADSSLNYLFTECGEHFQKKRVANKTRHAKTASNVKHPETLAGAG